MALVVKDAEGEVHVQETGDHLGRKGVKAGAGVGLVIGLFAPPLLAATAVGAAAGGLAGSSRATARRPASATSCDDALPPGSAGIIAIYEHDGRRRSSTSALANAIRTSTAQIDKASAAGAEGRAYRRRGGSGGRLMIDDRSERPRLRRRHGDV